MACIGLYDCVDRRFVELWIGQDGAATRLKNTATTELLTRTLRSALSQGTVSCEVGMAEDAGWIRSDHSLIGLGERIGSLAAVAAFVSDPGSPMKGEDHRQLLQIGLAYAIQVLHEDLGNRKSEQEQIADSILRSLSINFAVVDAMGRIDYMSDLPEDWLSECCQIDIIGDRLIAQTLQTQQFLTGAFEQATSEEGQSSILQVEGAGGHPQSVIVLPISSDPPRALLVFGRDQTDTQMRDMLLETFGLTLAEQRLARHLLSGKSLADAATEMCLTISTARSYLKRIFAKTGIHRQSELIALYHTMMPPVRAMASDRARI